MNTYYTLLGVLPEDGTDAIERAYQRQRERYDPTRVAELDEHMRQVAEQRTAELERAYHVLSDPQRRRQYDISIHQIPADAPVPSGNQRGLSARERNYAIIGVVAALALIAGIWFLTGGNSSGVEGRAMGEVNRPAPEFSLATLDGDTVSLEQYAGQVVLVNFWATWCEPCKREMPALQLAHEQYGPEGLAIVGIDLADDEYAQGNSTDYIANFVAQYGVTYPNGLDTEGDITDAYRVFPLPTSFFIDAQGRIRYIYVGELTFDDIVARFTELRQEAALSTN